MHGRTNPDPEKIEAFRRLASELGFELTPSSFQVGDHTDIGLFAIIFARSVSEFELGSPKPLSDEDEEQIRAVVEGFERLYPEQYAGAFQDFAHDPYLLLLAEGVGIVSSEQFPGVENFDVEHHEHPHFEPRRVEISNLQVVHLGGFRAVATYSVSEEYQDGSRLHTNAFAVLARLRAGWRILIATDHHLEGEGASG